MFSTWHIGVTALVTTVVTALTIGATRRWLGRQSGRAALGDLVGVSLAAGLGVLLWRLGGNIPSLNDDPIPGVSPADVLSAPLAYVAASVFLRLRTLGAPERWERLGVAPAMAAMVALIVNVITI